MRSGLRQFLREPLVHFMFLGGAAFMLDAVARPDAKPDAVGQAPDRRLVVDDGVMAALREQWMASHTSPPDAGQLAALREKWIEQEILFREGVRRGLVDSDPRVRELVAGQMSYILGTAIEVPEPTQADLRSFFETHAERYTQPARLDFTHVFVDGLDARASAEARRLLDLLRSGADPAGLGDTFAGGRKFRDRKPADLEERFGPDFVNTLLGAPRGSWVLHRSRLGHHLVRVDAVQSGTTPSLDDVDARVRHDWKEEHRARALDRAIRDLRAQWDIVVQ